MEDRVVSRGYQGTFQGVLSHPARRNPPTASKLEVTMKMVNSLLLGSAAGLVAIAGAQAADLPVKAKPVEYVKICSLYGEGFFYIPGTDTCIKIGGWVRAEYAFATGNSDFPYVSPSNGFNNRDNSSDYNTRARWVFSTDTRTQTEYGTLRSYFRAGFQMTTGESTQGKVYTERAFIQFAGFTLGKTQSYFDFGGGIFSYTGYVGGYSGTGAAGTNVFAYTAQFGNGFSATLSVEDGTQRRGCLFDGTTNAPNGTLSLGSNCTSTNGTQTAQDSYNITAVNEGDYGAQQVPDIVANVRVDQAWGSAQIGGALHQIVAADYGNQLTYSGFNTGTAPGDAWGFAVNAGIILNVPWNAGDKFWVEGTYTEGAIGYLDFSAINGEQNNTLARFNGSSVAGAFALDGVFANTAATPLTGIQLTTAWGIAAAFEHYWTPALRTSLWANYTGVTYDATATTIICTGAGPVTNANGVHLSAAQAAASGCSANFNLWAVGLRTIWNPVKNLDIGLETFYTKLDTEWGTGNFLSFAGSGGRPSGVYTPSSEGVWSGMVRVQRNFWP